MPTLFQCAGECWPNVALRSALLAMGLSAHGAFAEFRPPVADRAALLESQRASHLAGKSRTDPWDWTTHDSDFPYRLLTDASSRSLESAESPIEVSGQVQFRYIVGHEDEPRDNAKDDVVGFQMRRLKVGVDGKVADGKFEYSISGAFGRGNGQATLDDATLTYIFSESTKLRMGKFRPPFLREEAISSKRQLLVERSIIEGGFGQDRLQGVALAYEQAPYRFVLGAMDGGVDFGVNQIWTFSARAEAMLEGRFKEMRDFTSFPEDDDEATMIGVSLLYLDRELDDPADTDAQSTRFNLDISREDEGVNLFAAFIADRFTQDAEDDRMQLGFLVQGGVFVTAKTELVARYEWATTDDGRADLSVLTGGFNYYINEHALKLTGDLGYAFNEVSGFWDSTGTGWRRDRTGDDGQVVARLQFQLLF